MRNLNIAKIKIHIENTIFFLLLLLLFDEFAYGRCARTQRQYDRIECVCVWNEVNTRKKTTIKEAYEFNYRHRHTTYYIHRERVLKDVLCTRIILSLNMFEIFLAFAIVQNHIQSLFMGELTFRFLSFPDLSDCLSVCLSARRVFRSTNT